MGGLRRRLMFRLRNSERSSVAYDQEGERKTKSKSKSPVAPYFRRDEEEEEAAASDKSDKFCLSPVNPKRMDISYPSSPLKNNSSGEGNTAGEGKADAEMGSKRHLGKAAVVSMGCGCRPLARRRKNSAKKEQQQRKTNQIVNEEEENMAAMNKYRWEEEEKWHVIAKVKDEIVQKKVVLRRKNEERCPPGLPVPSPEAVSVHSCFARRKNKVQRKKKSNVAAGCNYRLSTSSADTGFDGTSYSWDNDHGSFASDGNETLFSVSDYCKSLSSESSFEFYESRSPYLSTITESPRRNNSRRSLRRSMARRRRFSSLSPANLSPSKGECPDKLPLLSSPESAKLCEAEDESQSPRQSLLCSRVTSEADETDLEANAKTWREAGFPLRLDDIRTVIYKSSELRYSPNCLPFPMVSCGRDINARKKSSTVKSKKPVNLSAKSSYSVVSHDKPSVGGGLSSQKKCSPRRKVNKSVTLTEKREKTKSNARSRVRTLAPSPSPPPGDNSASSGKVGESVAVVKTSQDPYHDFKNSMLEMIVEKQIFQPNDLEQLLQCFLSLNSQKHHEMIVQVFTEIWGNIFNGTRNPSTPVAFFQNNVV